MCLDKLCWVVTQIQDVLKQHTYSLTMTQLHLTASNTLIFAQNSNKSDKRESKNVNICLSSVGGMTNSAPTPALSNNPRKSSVDFSVYTSCCLSVQTIINRLLVLCHSNRVVFKQRIRSKQMQGEVPVVHIQI